MKEESVRAEGVGTTYSGNVFMIKVSHLEKGNRLWLYQKRDGFRQAVKVQDPLNSAHTTVKGPVSATEF